MPVLLVLLLVDCSLRRARKLVIACKTNPAQTLRSRQRWIFPL